MIDVINYVYMCDSYPKWFYTYTYCSLSRSDTCACVQPKAPSQSQLPQATELGQLSQTVPMGR